jgi:hypothetical protein
MKRSSVAEPPVAEAGDTGLPWFHTWRGVYLFVLGSFVLWVALLFALTRIFS